MGTGPSSARRRSKATSVSRSPTPMSASRTPPQPAPSGDSMADTVRPRARPSLADGGPGGDHGGQVHRPPLQLAVDGLLQLLAQPLGAEVDLLQHRVDQACRTRSRPVGRQAGFRPCRPRPRASSAPTAGADSVGPDGVALAPARHRPPGRPSTSRWGRDARPRPDRRWRRTTSAAPTGPGGRAAWPHGAPGPVGRRVGAIHRSCPGGRLVDELHVHVPAAAATRGSKWATTSRSDGTETAGAPNDSGVDGRPGAGEQDVGQRRLCAPVRLGPPHHGLVLGPGQGHVQQAETLAGRLVGGQPAAGQRPSSSGQSAPGGQVEGPPPESGST